MCWLIVIIKSDIIKWFVDNRIEPKDDINYHLAGLQLHKTNHHATEAEIASLNSEIENTCSRCEPPVNIEQDHEMYKQEKTIQKKPRATKKGTQIENNHTQRRLRSPWGPSGDPGGHRKAQRSIPVCPSCALLVDLWPLWHRFGEQVRAQ